MKTKTVIDHFGSVAALAAALKCKPAAIYQWGDEVPAGRIYEIHVKSLGAIPLPPDPGRSEEAAA